MAKIDTWLASQLPEVKDNLTTLDKRTDFLHITTNDKLRKVQPRIGEKQLKEENRTIPRVCGCMDLLGCIIGHSMVQQLYTYKLEDVKAYKRLVAKWTNGVFTIYRVKAPGYVQPGKRLVPDVKLTGEIWIVPYTPECYELETEIVGYFYASVLSHDIVNGTTRYNNTFNVSLFTEIGLDRSYSAKPGYYSLTVPGELNGALGWNNPPPKTEIHPITASQYNEGLKLMKAAFK